LVDAGIRELKIVFSKPMNKSGYSFNKNDKAAEPITGVVGFSGDGFAFTLKLNLQPATEYGFVITDRSFQSVDGYALKPYSVRFKTK
jgi:hypothetical protein